MQVDELLQYLKENGTQLKKDIRNGRYNTKAVRRVEIPKADGSKRKLGIPTVLVKGVFEGTEKGTHQGGNISLILRNIMFNELDNELEKCGLQFVCYADNCVIFTKSKK